MIRIDNYLGFIEISQGYFANLIGKAASECFGVRSMVDGTPAQKLKTIFLKSDAIDKGVSVKSVNGKLYVDIHIEMSYGINVVAVVKSIIDKVRYTIEESTDLSVGKINVYVDSMKV